MRFLFSTLLFVCVSCANAATWYVDNKATGSNTGTSWANAWTSVSSINASAGDTVYISGGPAGSSQDYPVNSWSPAGGTVGNPITYQIGQDALHNGLVILDGQGTSQFDLRDVGSNIVISGQVGTATSGVASPAYSAQIVAACHIKITGATNFTWYQTVPTNNVHVGYVELWGVGIIRLDNQITSASNIELDHLYTHKLSPPSSNGGLPDDTIYMGGINATTFDVVRIHDCYIESPCNSTEPAYGDDIFKWGSGFSVYNTMTKIYLDPNYPYGAQYQHADIFQFAGDHVKIYDNYFENIGESCFFFDPFGSNPPTNYSEIYYYNNIIYQDPNQRLSGVGRGMDWLPQDSGNDTFTDAIVANNTFVNLTQYFCLRFNNAASWTNCYVINNAFLNCANSTPITDTPAQSINVQNEVIANSSHFANPTTGDFHLLSTATELIRQGSNYPSHYFTTDKDGNPRPTSAAWDVGAYEYIGPNGTPTPTPIAGPTPLAPTNLRITGSS